MNSGCFKRGGDPRRGHGPKKGAANAGRPRQPPRRYQNADGYVRVGTRYEHRIVMEGILGRPLRREERVHHFNGDRADNRPENLDLCSSHSEHLKKHHAAGSVHRCGPHKGRARGR
jgi:hypothetical protein